MARPAPTFYVLHGEDEFSLKAQVGTMRTSMGDPTTADLNTAEFDGRSASAVEVLAVASAMPFLADKRLIIVNGMLSWIVRKSAGKTGKAAVDALVQGLPNLPDTARLVFVETETLSESHPILKLVNQEPRGYAKAFNPPGDTTNWIIKQVEQYGGKIEPRAASALAAVVGRDLRKADSECYKLLIFTGTTRAITDADVALLTPYAAEAVIWDMVDALGKREVKKALHMLHRLCEEQGQDPFGLLGMINRQFRLLIQAREVLDAGRGKSDLMQFPDFKNPRVADKSLEQARGFTMKQLEQLYRGLAEMDHGVKTGKVKIELALDLFIAGLGD